jgi:hypothetical protein
VTIAFFADISAQVQLKAKLGNGNPARRELINPWALAGVSFGAHDGLTLDIARGLKSAINGSRRTHCDMRAVGKSKVGPMR